jgi:phage terminase large subunit GpA-like protein
MQFLNTRHTPAEFQAFVNSTCAEPWRAPPKQEIAASAIRARQRACLYDRGTVPTEKRCILAMTTDRQTTHLVWGVWAMDAENQWLVDHGTASTYEDIPAVWDHTYRDRLDHPLRIQRMLLDTGYDTVNAYRFCLRYPNVCIAIKGESGATTRQDRPIRVSSIERLPGVESKARINLTLCHIHPSHFKDLLAQSLGERRKTDGREFQATPVAIWFHREIDEDFVRQMCGEVLRESKPDKFGATQLYWEKVHTNDFFDVAQYGYAARYLASNVLLNLNRPPATKADAEAEKADEAAVPEIRQDRAAGPGQGAGAGAAKPKRKVYQTTIGSMEY